MGYTRRIETHAGAAAFRTRLAGSGRFRRFGRSLSGVAAAWVCLASCSHEPINDGQTPAAATLSNPARAVADSSPLKLLAPPDSAVVQMYIDAGATGATAHTMTERERKLVEAAFADLPPLHRSVLERHLVRLSFIDAPESAGTGLTRELDAEGDVPRYDITLRADVLDMPLSKFLTTKEARLFEDDGSGLAVQIETASALALPYILLHEATHVVDGVLGVSVCETSRFRRGLWPGYRDLAPPHDASLIARTPFRRAPKLAISQAPAVYAALETSPFPSLYATASSAEDLAELVTWKELAARAGAQLDVQVRDATGAIVFRARPLASPEVQRRFSLVDALLAIDPASITAGRSFCDAAQR